MSRGRFRGLAFIFVIVLLLQVLAPASATISGVVTIESNLNYGGTSDYDPQIWSNSQGNLVAIYGRDQAFSNERITMRYSTTGGNTWSNRVILFSNSVQGDGIIDVEGGMWEYSGEVYKDVLYLVLHLNIDGGTPSMVFTKIDISNVQNIETFSNWRSAAGNAPPSSGGGSDGNGYDVIAVPGYIDPSIAVKNENDIMVVVIRSSAPIDELFAVRWDGTSWSQTTSIKDFNSALGIGLARIRHTQEGWWVAALEVVELTGETTTTYNVALRCNPNTSNCLTSVGWTGFDGTGNFDFVTDTGVGGFGWPIIYPDALNRIHVIAVAGYLIGGWQRLFHNYWDGNSWVNGETENNAGSQISIGVLGEPRMVDGFPNMNVDAGGQVFVLLNAGNGPDGAGFYSLKWDISGGWGSYTFQRTGGGRVSNEGFMRGVESASPFIVSTATPEMVYIGVSGAITGTPWWEPVSLPGDGPIDLPLPGLKDSVVRLLVYGTAFVFLLMALGFVRKLSRRKVKLARQVKQLQKPRR